MPAIYAHYTFGRESLQKLDACAGRIAKSHRVFYDLGLQGPDFYFFDQLKKVRGKGFSYVGTMLHNKPCSYLLEHLKTEGGQRADSEQLAYMLGVIGHFSLDSTCHPYVDQWAAELGSDHMLIETEFDRFLLERDGEDARRFPLGRVIEADRRTRLKIGKMYEDFSTAEDVADLWREFAFIKNATRTPWDGQYKAYLNVLSALGADAISGVLMGERDALAPTTNLMLMPLFMQAQDVFVRLSTNFIDHIYEGVPLDAYFERDFERMPE